MFKEQRSPRIISGSTDGSWKLSCETESPKGLWWIKCQRATVHLQWHVFSVTLKALDGSWLFRREEFPGLPGFIWHSKHIRCSSEELTLPFWFRLMSCCVFLVLRKKEKHSKLGRGRSHFIHCTNAAGVYGRRQRRWGLFASSGHWEPRCLTAGRGCAVPPTASNVVVGCPLTPGHPDLSFLPSVTP